MGLLWLSTVPPTVALVRAQLRHALAGDDLRPGLPRPPDRRLHRRLPGRADLRPHRLLRPDVDDRHPGRRLRRADPPAGARRTRRGRVPGAACRGGRLPAAIGTLRSARSALHGCAADLGWRVGRCGQWVGLLALATAMLAAPPAGAGGSAAPGRPPHAWVFGVWTGGMFPADDTDGPRCTPTPPLIFTRDVVMRGLRPRRRLPPAADRDGGRPSRTRSSSAWSRRRPERPFGARLPPDAGFGCEGGPERAARRAPRAGRDRLPELPRIPLPAEALRRAQP